MTQEALAMETLSLDLGTDAASPGHTKRCSRGLEADLRTVEAW